MVRTLDLPACLTIVACLACGSLRAREGGPAELLGIWVAADRSEQYIFRPDGSMVYQRLRGIGVKEPRPGRYTLDRGIIRYELDGGGVYTCVARFEGGALVCNNASWVIFAYQERTSWRRPAVSAPGMREGPLQLASGGEPGSSR